MQRRDHGEHKQRCSAKAGKGNPQGSDHEQASVSGLLSDPVWPFLMQIKATSRQENPGFLRLGRHAAARSTGVQSSMMLSRYFGSPSPAETGNRRTTTSRRRLPGISTLCDLGL
jgi:hypothetical protein